MNSKIFYKPLGVLIMKAPYIILISYLLTIQIFAQNSGSSQCACCDENHNQFDFWIGEWAVYDTLDNLVGNNKIVKMYENCLIQENWVTKGKNRGTSYNYYDPSDSTWNQLWIDNQGTILKLKGNYRDNKMVLKSELLKGKKVDWYYNRITWQKNDDGSVSQIWDILDNHNKLIRNLFIGIYKAAEK